MSLSNQTKNNVYSVHKCTCGANVMKKNVMKMIVSTRNISLTHHFEVDIGYLHLFTPVVVSHAV